jgi:DNA-binding MarR family transcriptional regulator
MGALAALTLRDRTTVTRVVDRLVGKGLAERRAQAGDRRSVVVAASAEGHALRPHAMAAMAPLLEGAEGGIAPEDLRRAVDTLKRMAANIEQGARPGAPGGVEAG